MKRILFLSFILMTGQAHAQDIYGEVELAGFQLGQFRTAVHAALGTPIQKKITKDGWIYEFQLIKPDTSVYALFKYPQWDTTRVYSIQLNGEKYNDMHPFFGFKLGATKEEVDKKFGPFDHTSEVKDPPLTIQYYTKKNYSFEIDKYGKVYGIQVFGSILRTPPATQTPSIQPFAKAIVNRNIDSLLTTLAPDVVIRKGNKVMTYAGAARSEFANEQSDFVKHLLAPQNSVWFAFAKEMAEGALHHRADSEEGEGIVYYYQMYDSSILSEISFVPQAGKWKVSEIIFR